jgi:hypothetical protein
MNPLTDNLTTHPVSSPKNIPSLTRQDEEKLTMIMRQVEHGSFDKMTPENINQVLKRRETVDKYIHEEQMQEHERYKINQKNMLIQLFCIVGFSTFVILLVAIVSKDLIKEIVILLAGLVGGFGLGKSSNYYLKTEKE